MEHSVPAFGILAFIPMLIFGVLYLALLVAFIWGFFSMVGSQRRMAKAQEATLRALQDIAAALNQRGGLG